MEATNVQGKGIPGGHTFEAILQSMGWKYCKAWVEFVAFNGLGSLQRTGCE